MTNFFRTVSIFFRNPFINPFVASARHIGWAFRKVFNIFPCEIKLGPNKLFIPNRAIANGNGALVNAMGYYDPNNMFFIEEVFQKGMYHTFLDIGSNIGVYSLIAMRGGHDSRAYAFEPHPYTFGLLSRNIRLNHMEDNIMCYQVALSDKNGRVSFRDSAGHPENRVIDELTPGVSVIEVDALSGEDFCREAGVKSPQVMKIDVEGYENHVLSGFSSFLESVQLIFVECWSLDETTEFLCGKFNFQGPYKIDYKNHRFTRTNCNYEDWVFVNPKALNTLKTIMIFE